PQPFDSDGVRVLPTSTLTRIWTYEGSYPGPTISRLAGQATTVRFANHPPGTRRLTTHFHGDHHGWASDGQPARFLIDNGAGRNYLLPLTDDGRPERASFFWYHDHRMRRTARNNWH